MLPLMCPSATTIHLPHPFPWWLILVDSPSSVPNHLEFWLFLHLPVVALALTMCHSMLTSPCKLPLNPSVVDLLLGLLTMAGLMLLFYLRVPMTPSILF